MASLTKKWAHCLWLWTLLCPSPRWWGGGEIVEVFSFTPTQKCSVTTGQRCEKTSVFVPVQNHHNSSTPGITRTDNRSAILFYTIFEETEISFLNEEPDFLICFYATEDWVYFETATMSAHYMWSRFMLNHISVSVNIYPLLHSGPIQLGHGIMKNT